jgi:hemoglobin
MFPGGVHESHRAHVTTWWIEVFGGPADYSEALGGYPRMLEHHRNLGITPDQRFRFASLMSLAADDAGLPDDPEFRAAFMGYVEWGTRLALANSQHEAQLMTDARSRDGDGAWHRRTSPDVRRGRSSAALLAFRHASR